VKSIGELAAAREKARTNVFGLKIDGYTTLMNGCQMEIFKKNGNYKGFMGGGFKKKRLGILRRTPKSRWGNCSKGRALNGDRPTKHGKANHSDFRDEERSENAGDWPGKAGSKAWNNSAILELAGSIRADLEMGRGGSGMAFAFKAGVRTGKKVRAG